MAKLKQTYKIADFRDACRMLDYIRTDFQGHTRSERLRTDLRGRYSRHISHLEAMLPTLQARYKSDLEHAEYAIKQANKQIEQNESAQLSAIEQREPGEIFNPLTKARLSLSQRDALSTDKIGKRPNLVLVHQI